MRNPDAIVVPVPPGATTTALVYGAEGDPVGAALILGHGAGAGQQSPWMVTFARTLSTLGLDVITFNFLYTEQRRRLPERRPLLESCYRAVIDASRLEVESAVGNGTIFRIRLSRKAGRLPVPASPQVAS